MPRLPLLLVPLLLATPASGQDAGPAASMTFFETAVRPVLADHCYSCHGPAKQRGGLRVDSRAALLEGGDSGPAVRPGAPDESLIIRAIRHGDVLQMPPKQKLPAKAIADLTAWVRAGAPWPAVAVAAPKAPAPPTEPAFTKEQLAHWAFQPVRTPPVPAVKDAAWVRSPVDAFILAGLERRGLAPAPLAGPHALLRRVTFDLVGLPPAPDEVRAFVADWAAVGRDRALASAVDRLLASPRYGERWGRHWLDVARYADSNGMDENLVYGNAWRYRDYVVRAFNADLPYDLFVREQVAGDLMTGPDDRRADRLLATGFLCLGPKMLAEDDPVKMEMDLVDEQLDTAGRAFLGLTLGCARCHDHKFDPVSIADYYALAGIFKSTATMENFRVVARWQERPVGTAAEVARVEQHARDLAAGKESIQKIQQQAYQALVDVARPRAADYLRAALALKAHDVLDRLARAPADVPGVRIIEAEDYARGNVLKSFDGYGAKIGVVYNRGELPNVAEYDVDVPVAGRYQLALRYAAAEARPVRASVDGRLLSDAAAGAVTGSWFPETQTWAAAGTAALTAGRHVVRLERAGPFPHVDKLALVPVPAGAPAEPLEQQARKADLRPGFLRQWREFVRTNPAPDGAALDRVSRDPAGPFRLTPAVEADFPEPTRAALQAQRDRLARRERSAPTLPEAMVARDGKAADLRIHLRGSHLTLGREVPRGFPRVFAAVPRPPIGAAGSGRLQLAEWLTRPDHPLTSRVMVNRLWHWHFGAGLVRSVDNFGRLGDAPSHPVLLDGLARRFVESGWSVKAMHRLIVLSSTYQMSTAHSAAAFQADPENRLLWRFPRRRLEAEALRDALLALGGRLDGTMGGTRFEGTNRQYVPGYPNGAYEKYDFPCRSLYLPVVRSGLYDVLQAFDFADPSVANGARATTTVAPQALFLLNGKLVHEQTRAWAARVLADATLDDAGRVGRLYAEAFGRDPDEAERARALAFVREAAGPRAAAWQSLCRVLVAANEFIYLE